MLAGFRNIQDNIKCQPERADSENDQNLATKASNSRKYMFQKRHNTAGIELGFYKSWKSLHNNKKQEGPRALDGSRVSCDMRSVSGAKEITFIIFSSGGHFVQPS